MRKDNGDVLSRALGLEVARKGRGQPNITWKIQVDEYIDQIGLKKMPLRERSGVMVNGLLRNTK